MYIYKKTSNTQFYSIHFLRFFLFCICIKKTYFYAKAGSCLFYFLKTTSLEYFNKQILRKIIEGTYFLIQNWAKWIFMPSRNVICIQSKYTLFVARNFLLVRLSELRLVSLKKVINANLRVGKKFSTYSNHLLLFFS